MPVRSIPFPQSEDGDNEDVHWALSTANALWAKGMRSDAVRWLRRAAEIADENEEDRRSLELFKAAATLAGSAAPALVEVPRSPDAVRPPSSVPPPLVSSTGRATTRSRPPPARIPSSPASGIKMRSPSVAPPLPPRVAPRASEVPAKLEPVSKRWPTKPPAAPISVSPPASIPARSGTVPAPAPYALPAIRVAVVAGARAGEISLVPLPQDASVPTGAATALLVALTSEDAEILNGLMSAS